ncbi:MAG: DUF5012 domain-containing protein [Prevotella sp.]|nr:DUF5012 domain-containing protein [Prevotella sp.]
MKKSILFASLLALAAPTLLTSCSDDESEGKSRFTYYAILEMNGDAYVTSPLGQAFADPGCVATMAGEDVSDQIITTGDVNTGKLGFYTVNYSVTNPDGFSASASRTVAVVDKNNFASTYYGESQYGTRHYFHAPITIVDNGDGTYTINDLAGGFYSYGRYPGYDAYGYDFFLEAILKLNPDNTVEVVEQGHKNSWYWEDPFEDIKTTYDPATGTITFDMDFGSAARFYVTLTK